MREKSAFPRVGHNKTGILKFNYRKQKAEVFLCIKYLQQVFTDFWSLEKLHYFESKIRNNTNFPNLLNLNQIKEIGKRTVEYRFYWATFTEIQRQTLLSRISPRGLIGTKLHILSETAKANNLRNWTCCQIQALWFRNLTRYSNSCSNYPSKWNLEKQRSSLTFSKCCTVKTVFNGFFRKFLFIWLEFNQIKNSLIFKFQLNCCHFFTRPEISK